MTEKIPIVKREFQSIADWFDILNWGDKMPNFAACHHLDNYAEFNKNYYSCDEILRLQTNIFSKLESANISSIRLMGDPGVGKTSFIHFLLHEAKRNNSSIINNYVFYIFSVTKADDDEYERIVKKEILCALKLMFLKNGLSDYFDKIQNPDHSQKENINDLLNFLYNGATKIKKKLIFILDDVDLLTAEMLEQIAKSVQKHLDNVIIIKWISVRGSTFDRYHKALKDFLNEFYPSIYNMPNTKLFGIIQHRINNHNIKGTAKNPFSKILCDDRVDPLLDYNKRRSLSLLRSIIEEVFPQKIKLQTSEEFIQNYIEKSAVNPLVRKKILPNIHDSYFRTTSFYPLPYDLLLCLVHTPNPSILFGCMNYIAELRSKKCTHWDKERIVKIRASDLEFTLEAFWSEGLVKTRQKKHLFLSPRGKIVAWYARTSDNYKNSSKEMLTSIDYIDQYWEFLNISIDHESIVQDFLSRSNPENIPIIKK